MQRSPDNHNLTAAWKRLLRLLRGGGVMNTLAICTSVVEDRWLKCFDRSYGVRTSGNIGLATTSFDRSKLGDATGYSPVNARALRKTLRTLNLPKRLHFADLGCGLGRACILAGEYGFEKVTGVELAPELCAAARDNIAICRSRIHGMSPVEILQMDVLNYCEAANDDVFFMFRPFSWDFLGVVIQKLVERSVQQQKVLTVIYCDRVIARESYAKAFSQNPAFDRIYEGGKLGWSFYVYQCRGLAVHPPSTLGPRPA